MLRLALSTALEILAALKPSVFSIETRIPEWSSAFEYKALPVIVPSESLSLLEMSVLQLNKTAPSTTSATVKSFFIFFPRLKRKKAQKN